MIKINKNFLQLEENYLFSTINKKVSEYEKENPNAKIIKLGIGDVTLPLPKIVVEAIKKSADEMGNINTFRGYGPEQGYEFLKNKIIENEYKNLGIKPDEIFISDGAKCDTGGIIEIFDSNIKVGIMNPVYPVYLDTNVMYGTAGKYDKTTKQYSNIIYINSTEENNFMPKPSELKEIPDLIYICSPNNPTGVAMNAEILKIWVEFAKQNKSIILFDSAYEAFIEEDNIPHSIYEIEGAKEVAIEFKSYSKTAGFTGLRCAYTVVPIECVVNCENFAEYITNHESANGSKYIKNHIGEVNAKTSENNNFNLVSINKLWNRRTTTKFNGVSYIIQRAAEAVYTEEGKRAIKENIEYYKENARILLAGLKKAGIQCYGGINSPYVWLKTPKGISSWEYFDILLKEYNIVGTPGVGFGTNGEGYFRLTAFGDREKTIEAMKRISK